MRYLLRVTYKNGITKNSNRPRECRVTAGEAPGSKNYGFDGRDINMRPWEKLAFDSPLLEVRELKDDQGKLAFVQVTIKEWEGYMSGAISIGKHIIFPAHELKAGSIKNSVGMTKKVPVELFEKQEPISAHTL